MQQINQEVFSFLKNYDTNFARTQEQLDNAQTELKKFQILFNAMKSMAEASSDIELLKKAHTLAQKAEQSSSLDNRCLLTISTTFNAIASKIDQKTQEFDKLLNDWDAPPKVKALVGHCRVNKTEILDLKSQNLSSFPSTLLDYLPHVKTLNLAHNHLTSFVLQGASKLENLYVSQNNLSLCRIEGAPRLKILNLSNNRIESFTLQEVPNLQELYLLYVGLTSFTLEGASNLKNLQLSNNNISSFTLRGSPRLETLNLSFNPLTSFNLEEASNIRELNFFRTSLTSFTLQGASRLKLLNLYMNNLTTFTLEGAVELRELNLSRNRLQQEPLLLNCATPERFTVSGNPYLTTNSRPYKNIVQQRLALFTALLKSLTSEKENLKNLSADQIFAVLREENPSLIAQINLWLEKLQTARDFKNLTNREDFAYNVLSVIDFSLKTPEFREPLRLALDLANSSCVDRCSLFLNEAIEAKKIYELGIMTLGDAISFLRGSYALKMIHKLATEFVESRRVPCDPNQFYDPDEVIEIEGVRYHDTLDPIEVYIDLQRSLKDEFSLPVVIKEQNYQSSVTPELEARVRENVQMALKDIPSLTDYFCSFPSWIEKIKKEYREELQVSFDQINLDMERFMQSKEFLEATLDEQKALVLPYREEEREITQQFIKQKTKELLNSEISR